jgi:hypothetical protein
MEFHAGGDLLSLIQRMGNRLEETAVRFYTAEVLTTPFFIVLNSVVDPSVSSISSESEFRVLMTKN